MAENGSHEIHDIRVMKLDSGKFKIVFGSKTGITNLYSASTEIEIDRGLRFSGPHRCDDAVQTLPGQMLL